MNTPPRLAPPLFYTPPDGATPLERLKYLLFNWVNDPLLLTRHHDNDFFPADMSEATIYSETFIKGAGLFDRLLRDVGLTSHPIQRIYVRINTRVRDLSESDIPRLWYVHTITAECTDENINLLYVPGADGSLVRFSVSIDGSVGHYSIRGSFNKIHWSIYTWECVIEYLKYKVRLFFSGDSMRLENPLEGLGILGEGSTLRQRVLEH